MPSTRLRYVTEAEVALPKTQLIFAHPTHRQSLAHSLRYFPLNVFFITRISSGTIWAPTTITLVLVAPAIHKDPQATQRSVC